MTTKSSPTDALLLIAPGCSHCPVVLEGLSQLVKLGMIGRLQVVNIASHPEIASELGVRSVPWCRIGEFELQGSHSPSELKTWAERANQADGISLYLAELLSTGELARAIDLIQRHPHWLAQAIALLSDPNSGMSIKTGLGALLEEFTGSDILIEQIETLAHLLKNDNHGIRSDVCYFLGLSHSSLVLPYLQQALADEHAEVREIARETLDELAELGINMVIDG
ncbi:MAG: thioredoxin family protein [Gammaproteobacteria bacterium]|nr:thioredoxin family protein [Gammaproteobacteria bacterium]